MKKDTESAGGSPHSGEPAQESGALFKSGAKTKAKGGDDGDHETQSPEA
jgi:hypothetical protein